MNISWQFTFSYLKEKLNGKIVVVRFFIGVPRGFGDLGRMAFIFRELGSTGNYFQGFGEQAYSFGDFRSQAKRKKISP